MIQPPFNPVERVWHVVSQRAPLVSAWVALNRDALLEFWNEGASWTRAEASRFLDGLKRLKER